MPGRDADFHGIRQRISTANLGDAAFERIPAGQSIEVTFNVGEVHDLSAGGKFDIESAGIMQFADENGTKLIGSVPYASNKINTVVDGAKAASMIKSFVVDKRTRVQSDCTGSKGTATKAALSNCVNLANAAKQVAQSGSAAKLQEYFKDSGSATRNTVASVLGKVASECGSTTSGASDYYCTDVANGCEQGVLAYTVPSQSFEAYCDLYFDDLPGLTSQCHAQDQATTTLHEMTHLNQVAGTQDLGYGYANAIRLSNRDALNNADTYALFANAIHSGC